MAEVDGIKPIYADNAATTALSEYALSKMLPYFTEQYGNPSSIHTFGIAAKNAVENARRTVAQAIGARVNEIYFTSGGTEADNWALFAACRLKKKQGKHIVTTQIEHSAVYRTALELEKQGYEITFLIPDTYGLITPEQIADAVRPDTILVSVMLASNEVGTVLPIADMAAAAKRYGALFHTDAVQAVGHIPVDVRGLGVDMLSLSAHKFHGPKGAGALYASIRVPLAPMIFGGGQEKGRRSGTANVTGAVGMAAALEESVNNLERDASHLTFMRDHLIAKLLTLPGVSLTGHPTQRLPGHASFFVSGVEGEPLVRALSDLGICVSSGSACSAGSGEPSRVLVAMGYEMLRRESKERAAPVRISLSRYNTLEEMDRIVSLFPQAIEIAREKTAALFSFDDTVFDE
jgi:cysteine desulfurase